MCTASWLHGEGGYQLLFNRDEKRTRLQALPPQVEESKRARVIAPVDGDHGGTWIAVNDRGVAVCLLNGSPQRKGFRSRGLLLAGLADARSATEAMERLGAADLSRYAAFTFVALAPEQPASIATWDGPGGASLRAESGQSLLCSSSYDFERVAAARRQEFARVTSGLPLSAARLFEFHSSHVPAASAYSPCMHRQDAHTVSFSWITVTPSQVTFFYSPAAPCQWQAGESLALPRAA